MWYPDIPKFLIWLGGFVMAIAIGWGVCLLIAGFGCTSVERTKLAYDTARAAVDAAADRFHVPPPEDAVSPLQGLLGAAGMMVVYLVRKKFFPMGKR